MVARLPKIIDLLSSVHVQRFPEASAISETPLQVIVDGQHRFDEHLTSSVDGNDDEDPFSVVLWTCAGLRDYDVHVDHDVSEETVVE